MACSRPTVLFPLLFPSSRLATLFLDNRHGDVPNYFLLALYGLTSTFSSSIPGWLLLLVTQTDGDCRAN